MSINLGVIKGVLGQKIREKVTGSRGTLLSSGSPAPAFEVGDESGRIHKLSDYRGKKVVLWFFPRASTGG